jgi:hypothetical protein
MHVAVMACFFIRCDNAAAEGCFILVALTAAVGLIGVAAYGGGRAPPACISRNIAMQPGDPELQNTPIADRDGIAGRASGFFCFLSSERAGKVPAIMRL